MKNIPLSQEALQALVSYDPMTGDLTWLSRPRGLFATQNAFTTWNSRFSGKRAFITKCKNGYLKGVLNGQELYAHRLIWFLQTGTWSDHTDHKNGKRDDNRWENLGDSTQHDNNRNCGMKSSNTSGYTGVSFHKKRGRFRASIRANHKQIHLGYFDTKLEALLAYTSAKLTYGFTQRHGL